MLFVSERQHVHYILELITTAPMKDGKFLVRARAGFPDEFVLSVTYRGKPTHHLVQRGPDGGYLVNKKRLGQFSTVAAVVEGLQNPTSLPQGWPVPLAFAVPASLTTDESHADAAPNRQPSVTAAEVSSSASSKSAPTESSATEPARVAVAPETAITPNQATGSNPIYAGVTKPGVGEVSFFYGVAVGLDYNFEFLKFLMTRTCICVNVNGGFFLPLLCSDHGFMAILLGNKPKVGNSPGSEQGCADGADACSGSL